LADAIDSIPAPPGGGVAPEPGTDDEPPPHPESKLADNTMQATKTADNERNRNMLITLI
jgi:hypothetical protein